MHARGAGSIGSNARQLKKAQLWWQQGLEVSRRQDWHVAAGLFAKACQVVPNDIVYRLNLARALAKDGQLEEALKQSRLILAADPSNMVARRLAGDCLSRTGKGDEAAELLQVGSHLAREDFEYQYALGLSLYAARRPQEAIEAFMHAITLKVDHAESFYQLAMCFHSLEMRNEMAECLETALALDIDNGVMACESLLAFVRREICQWDKADAHLQSAIDRVMRSGPKESQWLSVFGMVTMTDDPDVQLKSAQICTRQFSAGIQPMPPIQVPAGKAKIKLGFVSADFHHHATTMLAAELFECLDRSRYEVHLYSHGPDDGTALRRRVQASADSFVEIGPMSDRAAAERIRADGIDVLIDLKGHTSRCRLSIFAYRPAPVQVTYLAFPGSTGADYIDYMVGDPVVSPLSHAGDFSEKLALMPVCYQPNDRKRPLPAPVSRATYGLPEDALVLSGFNQPFKLHPQVLDVWCELLHELPHAVLWLLKWNQDCEAPIRAYVESKGITADRLIFGSALKIGPHISRFALADIYLDAWPCNGHTTVSDALWAGVPVVTYQGRTFTSRVASSLLEAVGTPECITHDLDSYKRKVVELARNEPQRLALRAQLAAARVDAPLFDTERYTRDFCALIERMVARSQAGLPPDHLDAQN